MSLRALMRVLPLAIFASLKVDTLAQSPEQVLRSFGFPDQSGANASALIIGIDGALYGTTFHGGSNNLGTIFRITTNGADYTVIHSFSRRHADGQHAQAALVQGLDGALYGTTYAGGNGAYLSGTVYRLNTDGSGYAILNNFGTNASDARSPRASLLQGSDSVLYGTTYGGGSNGNGTVFRIGTNGSSYA